jgi:uncharacterized membrane protein YvlD (DUF360 family)
VTNRISRGDVIAVVGALLLLFSLRRVWYGLAFSDLGSGVRPEAFGVKISNQNLIEKTGWGASNVVGLILAACAVVALCLVLSRIIKIAVANRPGDAVRAAGAAAVVLVIVRMVMKPSLIPGAQAPLLSGIPGPHLEMGIFMALIGACAILAAGFLIEIDDAKAAVAAIWDPPLAEAQTAGALLRAEEVPDFLTSPPAWLLQQEPTQRPNGPPPA